MRVRSQSMGRQADAAAAGQPARRHSLSTQIGLYDGFGPANPTYLRYRSAQEGVGLSFGG